MNETQVMILGGFAGSGKTTLLLRLAGALSRCGRRVAIIENDAAPDGIDAAVLRRRGWRTEEIVSGCICCSLRGSLQTTLIRLLHEYEPDVVLLEPSGIAGPFMVEEAVRSVNLPSLRISRILLLDAGRCRDRRLHILPFVRQSVIEASLILLNKCDLLNEKELDDVIGTVKAINPAGIVLTGSAQDDATALMVQTAMEQETAAARRKLEHNHAGVEGVVAVSLRNELVLPPGRLYDVGAKLAETLRVVFAGEPTFYGHVKMLLESVGGEWLSAGMTSSADVFTPVGEGLNTEIRGPLCCTWAAVGLGRTKSSLQTQLTMVMNHIGTISLPH